MGKIFHCNFQEERKRKRKKRISNASLNPRWADEENKNEHAAHAGGASATGQHAPERVIGSTSLSIRAPARAN